MCTPARFTGTKQSRHYVEQLQRGHLLRSATYMAGYTGVSIRQSVKLLSWPLLSSLIALHNSALSIKNGEVRERGKSS